MTLRENLERKKEEPFEKLTLILSIRCTGLRTP
jgi:hypothetical protein